MELRQRLREFVKDNFYVSETDPMDDDTHLINSGVVDSTGMLEIITFLEAEYGIHVEDRETTPDNLASIGRIAAFVTRKLAAASGARAS